MGRIALITGAALVLLVLAAAAAGVWLIGLVTWERHTGYFAPAFSPDAQSVFAIVRETEGVTWGFGWEHFTPPAYAYALTDHVSLVKLDVASGRVETLERWTSTPIARRVVREYRSRVFNWMSARVRPQADGTVQYAVHFSIPKVPSSEMHLLSGVWAPPPAPRQSAEWRAGSHVPGTSEPILAGAIELFAVQGREAFPCGIVLLDHGTMTTRALTWTEACQGRYPGGPPQNALLELSQKAQLDRVAEMTRVRDARVAKYRAEGLSEGDAMLRASRDLEDLGHLPRSPRVVAHRLDGPPPSDLPVFDVEEPEMASGIFPDIERAIAKPGAEINRSGRYLIHRDYTTSARLNTHLDGGGREFVVRFRGGTYRIEIR